MVFKLSDLKDVCSKILTAVDSGENTQITDTLELEVKDKVLNLSVTNREYFTRVCLNVGVDATLHASVNAMLFLKLIYSLTSENVELEVNNNALTVKGDGTYKLPLIYDGENMLKLPEISISNITQQFDIKKDILSSILKYNMSELNKGVVISKVQKLFYLDNEGCITFTTGACVNSFTLLSTVKLLLTPKVVKLFKLFKDDNVHFELGQDDIGGGVIQTKVIFKDSITTVSSILPGDSNLINSVPVSAIRNRATCAYSYSVNLNKNSVLNAIKRLSLFADKTTTAVVTLAFKNDRVEISDDKANHESIYYDSDTLTNCDYVGKLSVDDFKLTLESCTDQYITFSFGNHQAMVISKKNVYNIMPEI